MSAVDLPALRDLEWAELLSDMASHASSSLGRAKVLELRPLDSREQAEVRLTVIGEVLGLFERGAVLPRRDVADVREAVERTRRHGVLGTEDFLGLLLTLASAHEFHAFGRSHTESAPLLAEALRVDDVTFGLEKELRASIDETGEVRDTASAELAEARRELKRLRAKVQSRLAELLLRYRDVLQDSFVAERSGRYVLPVRSDAPYRVDGMVFGSSASGSTLYVEPEELAPLSNQLRIAESTVAREEAKVRGRLSSAVGALADEVLWAEDVAVRGDLLGAIAAWARKTSAVVLPFGKLGEIRLVEGRHPLLAHRLSSVVPCSLSVESGRGLVISGPNAGGKTVALKTLGLSALLVATGLPVPADPKSAIGYFQEVRADIGDDQSLSMSLSTFSGHVERVAKMLEVAEPGVLLLVDELMSGTDPNEGSVLAVSTLEEFVARGATAVVTTHYESLKQRAEDHGSLENAAAGFDFRKMEPTFVIEQGRPGASSALAVAQRFGLPKRVTSRALELLPEEERRRRDTLVHIEQLKSDLLQKSREIEESLEEQRLVERNLSIELEKAREARRNELLRESDELRRELLLARAELQAKRKELRQKDESAALKEIERSVDRAASTIAFGGDIDKATRKPLPAAAPKRAYRVSERVRVAGFSTPATILEVLPKGQLRVTAGVMKLVVSVDEVAPLDGPAPVKKAPVVSVSSAEPAAPLKVAETSLDLRGVRVEEGLLRVDSFLDELLRQQESGGYILHGHGTGAMKDAVRQHLRGHPVVERSRAAERDEGGDAWTVFWLRGMN